MWLIPQAVERASPMLKCPTNPLSRRSDHLNVQHLFSPVCQSVDIGLFGHVHFLRMTKSPSLPRKQ